MHEIRTIGDRPAVRLSDRPTPLSAGARAARTRQPPGGAAMQRAFVLTASRRPDPEDADAAARGRHGQPAVYAAEPGRAPAVHEAAGRSKAHVRRG